MSTRILHASLAAFSIMFSVVPSAFAQEITVVAPRERARTSATGAPIEVVSTSQTVSIADLDLRTQQGMGELEKRVRSAANSACDWLDHLYPVTSTDSPPCVKTAVDKAMADARAMVATSQ